MKIPASGPPGLSHAVGWGGLSARRSAPVAVQARHHRVRGACANDRGPAAPRFRRRLGFGTRTTTGRTVADAFSLVEVVAAIGILAVTLVAVLGLMMATVRSGGEVADADAVARLAENIQGELDRLQASLGLAGLAGLVSPGSGGRAFCLVATRNGARVRCSDPADPAADRALDDPTLPGIANRDRYFLIEVSQSPGFEFAHSSGFLAVSVRITWPYHLPVGPPAPDAAGRAVDAVREVPRNGRDLAIVNLALRP